MIPPFGPTGDLPPGIHAASWSEVLARFGATGRRRSLLRRAWTAFSALRLAGCAHVFLAGSFVTDRPLPGDIDVLWDTQGVDLQTLRALAPTLIASDPASLRRQKSLYGGEFFSADTPRHGAPYLDFFQTVKETDAPRGIVRLDLATLPSAEKDRAARSAVPPRPPAISPYYVTAYDDERRMAGSGACPPGTFAYTVQQGDTFYLFTKRFATTVAAIHAANPSVNPYNLYPGLVICIPKFPSPPPRPCPPGTFPFTIVQGDTFHILVRRFHTTVAAIEEVNPGVNPYNLYPGLVICIPTAHPPTPPPPTCPPGTFSCTIVQGDTFYLLAKRFNTTVAAIEAANPGVNPYNLYPGLVICIPSN